jgi:hypothetical protein
MKGVLLLLFQLVKRYISLEITFKIGVICRIVLLKFLMTIHDKFRLTILRLLIHVITLIWKVLVAVADFERRILTWARIYLNHDVLKCLQSSNLSSYYHVHHATFDILESLPFPHYYYSNFVRSYCYALDVVACRR